PPRLGVLPAVSPRVHYSLRPSQVRRAVAIPIVRTRRLGSAGTARAQGRRVPTPSPGSAERRYRVARRLGLPAKSRRPRARRAGGASCDAVALRRRAARVACDARVQLGAGRVPLRGPWIGDGAGERWRGAAHRSSEWSAFGREGFARRLPPLLGGNEGLQDRAHRFL